MRSLPLRWLFASLFALGAAVAAAAAPPNVVCIVIDELGYFEPSYMGNRNLRTPNMDRLAAEGLRFNHLFAGSAVCAPTRCSYLTGKHAGHTSVRVNGGGTPLRAEEETIASLLKQAGYATGGYGKWGCGGRDSTGVPERHGFDEFLGYYDQVHAHTYYPPYLIRNSEEVPLAGNHGGASGKTYSQYVIHAAALKFIRDHAREPFFAYLPYTPPHGNFDIPDDDPAWALYRDQAWPEDARRYAAMVTMVDRQIGEVIALLRELGLDRNTLVFCSGDNGGADYFKSKEFPRGVHGANVNPRTGVEYRGAKGSLYEGGLRVPFLAWWPGRIAAGRASDYLGYFPDVLPTIAEAVGVKPPADVDGLSLLPELLGEQAAGRAQPQHDYLYWEIGSWVAVRQQNWRAVKPAKGGWELYDLASDPSEAKDLAAAQPDVLARLVALASQAHAPAVEGTFARTDRHERDRRAKFGQQDEVGAGEGKRKPGPAAAALPPDRLPSRDWKIVRFSSENADNRKFARHAIDGDPATLWHTRFQGGIAPPPHELVLDLGAERTLRGFVYLARQDGGWNGAAKDVEFSVAASPEAFGAPLVKTALARSKDAQAVPCPATRGRYVQLRILSDQDGRGYASVAELGLLGE